MKRIFTKTLRLYLEEQPMNLTNTGSNRSIDGRKDRQKDGNFELKSCYATEKALIYTYKMIFYHKK